MTVSESLEKYITVIKRLGYPDTTIKYTARVVKDFHQKYKDQYTQENILLYDFEITRLEAHINPALNLFMFWQFAEKGITPEKYNRRKGVKDGWSRPVSCGRTECKYNASRRCRYRPMDKLENPLYWMTCTYFEKGKKLVSDPEPKPRQETPELYDYIWKKKADFVDSHSARWM